MVQDKYDGKKEGYIIMYINVYLYICICMYICIVSFMCKQWGILLDRGRCMPLSCCVWMGLSCQPLCPREGGSYNNVMSSCFRISPWVGALRTEQLM